MNKYESIIIVDAEIEVKDIIKKYEDIIKERGILNKTDDAGVKKLAYKVKNREEGHYLIFYFESDFDLCTELERLYKIDDNVMKFIIIKIGD